MQPEYDLEPEPDANNNPPPEWDPTIPLGDALRLIEPEWPDPRTQWELELVGEAFYRAARAAGLGPIVAVHSAESGSYFWNGDVDAPEAPAREPVDVGIQAAASTTGALLDRVEFLEPGGLAVAVSLAVPEADGFLRHGLDAFVQLSGLTDRSLAGSFVQVEDGEPEPVVELFGRGGFGSQGHRQDVACCVSHGFSRGIDAPGPPACPFPSRTGTTCGTPIAAICLARPGETSPIGVEQLPGKSSPPSGTASAGYRPRGSASRAPTRS